MRIVILGAGATGGYFGGRLIEAGADVTFLVRARRKRQLDADGLVIDSKLRSAKLPVTALTAADGQPPADLMMLTPKSYDLASALEAIAPVVGPDTAVMPVLNGVAHLDAIAVRFPAARPWGGVAHIGATLADDGTIRHLNRFNRLLFGARGAQPDGRAEALAALFKATPVEAEARPAIERDLWDKLVFLATLAGATCLFRASIGTVLATSVGEQTIRGMLAECAAIATAEGFAPTPDELQRYGVELFRTGSPSTSSMLRDIERGAATERAHILGDLLVRAKRHGIAAPLLALADSHIDAYERRRTA